LTCFVSKTILLEHLLLIWGSHVEAFPLHAGNLSRRDFISPHHLYLTYIRQLIRLLRLCASATQAERNPPTARTIVAPSNSRFRQRPPSTGARIRRLPGPRFSGLPHYSTPRGICCFSLSLERCHQSLLLSHFRLREWSRSMASMSAG
jgi:hypothetical protein